MIQKKLIEYENDSKINQKQKSSIFERLLSKFKFENDNLNKYFYIGFLLRRFGVIMIPLVAGK